MRVQNVAIYVDVSFVRKGDCALASRNHRLFERLNYGVIHPSLCVCAFSHGSELPISLLCTAGHGKVSEADNAHGMDVW
jgi:hypothetical protein